jgi:hypothetical protein
MPLISLNPPSAMPFRPPGLNRLRLIPDQSMGKEYLKSTIYSNIIKRHAKNINAKNTSTNRSIDTTTTDVKFVQAEKISQNETFHPQNRRSTDTAERDLRMRPFIHSKAGIRSVRT